MKETLDIPKILDAAWSMLRAKWRTLIPMVFFAWLFSAVASFGVDTAGPLGMQLGPDFMYPLYFLFGVLAYIFLSLLISIGLMHVFIQTVDNKKVTRGDMLDGFTFKKMFSFIGAYILYTVAVVIGLVLFIIPGVYIAVALIPLFYVIVDTNKGPMQAIKDTYAMTKGHWWHIAGITILVGLISFIVIGLFLAIFAVLVWLVSSAGVIGIAVVMALGVPTFILLVLFTQTYVGLTHAHVYKQLRDNAQKS